MKKIALIVCVLVMMLCVCGCSRIRIPQDELAVLTYDPPIVGNEVRIVETLTAEESARVRQILMDAKHNAGIGGCAYTEEISFTFDDQVFAVAWDGCETIWDIQNEKYYEVNKEDWAYIKALFERYGGKL